MSWQQQDKIRLSLLMFVKTRIRLSMEQCDQMLQQKVAQFFQKFLNQFLLQRDEFLNNQKESQNF